MPTRKRRIPLKHCRIIHHEKCRVFSTVSLLSWMSFTVIALIKIPTASMFIHERPETLACSNQFDIPEATQRKDGSQIFTREIVNNFEDQTKMSNKHSKEDAQKPFLDTRVQQDIHPWLDEGQTSVEGFLVKEIYDQVKRFCKEHDVTSTQSLLAAFHAFCVRCGDQEDKRSYTVHECKQGAFLGSHFLEMSNDLPESLDLLMQNMKSRAVRLFESTTSLGTSRLLFQAPVSPGLWNSIITDGAALETMENVKTGLKLRLTYPLAAYDSKEMQRFMDNFLAFWSRIAADPHKPLSTVPLCGDKELLMQRNSYWSQNTTPNRWDNTTVIDRILQIACEYPQATAIITSDGETLTYEKLMYHARDIASILQQSGALPGDLIGLLCRPGLNEITGMVAILLCRCGYVAMDPTFAAERLSFMAKDSKVPLILVTPDLTTLGSEVAQKSNSTARILSFPESYSPSFGLNLLPASPQDPFYTIYTSGSTGSPKGVVLTNSNTQHMLSTLHHDYKFSRFDRFLHHSSMCFDLSVVEIFSALTCGATVCVASARIKADPDSLSRFMKQVSITVTYFTPTKFALLLEVCPESLQECQDYRVAFFAGERLPTRLAERFYALQLRATMYNTWSPSELVVQTAIHKVPRDTVSGASGTNNIPIGFPMKNCAHYILDSNLNPVPIGVVGEICVGGAQVGRGYINVSKDQRKAFTQNLFASEDYLRNGWTKLFRTGDKGRFRCNGELEFHGRIAGDKQIKLRGFRIDLGEIEQGIFEASRNDSLPRLINVHVVARPIHRRNIKEESMTDERQLIAFLVYGPGRIDSRRQSYVNAVHHKLSTHLNSYMLPNGYEILDGMPVTIGGKVDIRDLQNRDLDLIFPSAMISPAPEIATTKVFNDGADPTLSAIMNIFKTLLSLADGYQLNPEDNFFVLGGQSMLILRLQAKVKTIFGVKLPLPSLFKDATPAAIAQMVRSKRADLLDPVVATRSGRSDQIDWQVETTLPHEEQFLAPRSFRRLPRSEISTILVTGADSFIGAHLIATILTAAPSMKIYFLGSTRAIALADLKIRLGRYQLLNDTWPDLSLCLIPVGGTLAEPQFGLNKNEFGTLGKEVQAIYHIGGEVSLLKSYHDLKPFNVSPTLTLISLAHHGAHLTEVHYLSTWSVPHLQTWHDTRRTKSSISNAEEPTDHFTPSTSASHGGYLKARWASESLLTQASHRGFAISLYRSSAVTASSVTHVPEPMYDLYRYTIMRMVQVGCVPDTSAFTSSLPFAIDFVPVDYLASTLFDLSLSPAALVVPTTTTDLNLKRACNHHHTPLLIHHIGNPATLLLQDLPPLIPHVLLREKKKSVMIPQVQVLPLEDWLRAMSSGLAAGEELRIAAIRDMFAMGHCSFSLDRSKTAAVLELMIAEEAGAGAGAGVGVGVGAGAKRDDGSIVRKEGVGLSRRRNCPPIGVEYLRGMMESSW